jgi:hypothetical protein
MRLAGSVVTVVSIGLGTVGLHMFSPAPAILLFALASPAVNATGARAGRQTMDCLGCNFDLQRQVDTIWSMIAVASISTEYMTVQEVMAEIEARAPSTVTRLIKTDENPDGPLIAEKIAGHGWMIRRSSVAKFCQREAKARRKVGFPRGRTRSAG